MKATAFVTMMVMALLSTAASAGVPGLISYQGTLTDGDGVALDTTVAMTFSIYTDSVGGSQIWTETQSAVAVVSGVFNVLLGSVNEMADTVFSDPVRWLGVQVGSDPELAPRQRIAALGYAFRAAKADTAEYAQSDGGGWVDDGTVLRLETDTDSVGIGTTSPAAKLDVRGTFNVGVNDSGYNVNFYGQYSGSRLFWDENKMALRAGWDYDGSHWAPANVGSRSFAVGYNPMASGTASIAMGALTTANANYATAMGYQTLASNLYATAMGQNTTASGPFSMAMGTETVASGGASIATGLLTTASADLAIAMGDRTTASGNYSLAMGQYLTAGPGANTMILGRGMSNSNRLVNNIANSLMVGFNDTTATLFVGGPDSRVGVGTSSPSEKLHVHGNIRAENAYLIGASPVFSIAGTENLLVGAAAGASNTGEYGTFVGHYAGQDNQGNFNTFLGLSAGTSNLTGSKNTFVGQGAGYNNTTGFENTFLGQVTGLSNTSGSCNTFLGKSAGYQNATGDSNVFIGYKAGYTEIGSNKLYIANGSDTSDVLVYGDFSSGKVGIGTLSPSSRLHVDGAIRLGAGERDFQVQEVEPGDPSGWSALIDYGGIGIGSETGNNHQMIMFTDGAGSEDIFTVATSENNGSTWEADFVIQQNGRVGIGTASPSSKLDVSGDISTDALYKIGGNAVLSVSSPMNTMVGVGAGGNNTGYYTTFVGDSTGYNNQGYQNTFLGAWAGRSNTTGDYNTFLGYAAGYSHDQGPWNTFIGSFAGQLNTTGWRNTFLGARAGVTSTSDTGNVFIGFEAGQNLTGSDQLCIANSAGNCLIYGDFSTRYVGFGTTNPTSKVQVIGNVDAQGFTISGVPVGTSSDSYWSASGGDIYYNSGNVGIGTSSPEVPLHVQGGTDVSLAGGGFFVMGQTNSANIAMDSNEIMARNNGSAAYLHINRNGGDVIFNENGGDVGIGTASPARKLHVNDVLRLEPRSTYPSSPSDGDICVVGSAGGRHIYCYLNGAWRQLD